MIKREEYKILKDLIKFNTIKDKENKEILDYIESYLLKIGFKTEKKDKNLIMSIGKDFKFGFLGHTDTVEYIEGWNTNPFELTQNKEKLYGLSNISLFVNSILLFKIYSSYQLQYLSIFNYSFASIYSRVFSNQAGKIFN